ncbi:TIGR04282 family arsenosugar biosynthesis glycosyltransferase [Radiobacillus kanasensis]|uniref:TIGR04282 family arsenosugar biosynthesis glycosyltransferase n=1 Tax=Radiobacillus kanasensis TaxID=2844358 RepID=UPI001E5CA081|nr:TIGR04282 family arsenosugar biosynthesis glycosyltransferase [Radiobacillus kanasensis]UFT98639.1 TIGR04282 family arsenosugar biosynthesis glycosyltransferase [Radiobacillus kanasensis]
MVDQIGMKPSVLIMAKAPIPGFCKTRLQPMFSPEECARLQASLLLDLVELKKQLEPDIQVWISFTPETKEDYFKSLFCRVFPQVGMDLGERMHNGLAYLVKNSNQPVLIIGTDTPLKKEDIYLAINKLSKHPIVIGPAVDGGYYLIGLTQDVPEVFENMEWGVSSVFDETMKRFQTLDLPVSVLQEKRDIDNWDDLIFYQTLKTNDHLDRWKTRFLLPKLKERRDIRVR